MDIVGLCTGADGKTSFSFIEPRPKTVASLHADGMSAKKIASLLAMSSKEVRHTIESIESARAERSEAEIEARIEAERVDSERAEEQFCKSHRVSPFVYESQGPPRIKDFTTILFEVVLFMDGQVDKGYGAVASRAIRAGERLIAERPLGTCCKLGQRVIRAPSEAIRALDSRRRAAFFALCHDQFVHGSRKTVEGIWNSNAYPTCEHKDGREESSCFEYICRINHSCRPCCHVAWSKALEMQTVHAIAPISKGQEVTVSYIDYGLPRDERRALLKRKFGFDCMCELCSLSGAARDDSDARQRRLKAINALLAMSVVPNLFDLLEEKLEILAKEGLPPAWAHMDMVSAFTKCCSLGDYGTARRWMRRAIEAAILMLGADSSTVHDLKAILEQRS